MELNEDEPKKQVKIVSLNYGGRYKKSSQTKNLKETTHDEASDEESDVDELVFIIKRFQILARKKNKFSGRRDGFKGSSFRSKDHDDCYNYKKYDHFIVECPDLQTDKIRKECFPNNNFISKFKKSFMATWEELDNEREDGEANIALMASTFSYSESEVGSDLESEDT